MTNFTFNWNDLRYFLAVARSGRLTDAARRLDQDHTTVSRRIAALETMLETRLFERSPVGYTLTPKGETLVQRAEEIEAAALHAQFNIGRKSQIVEGDVRVGSPDGFGAYFLAERMGRLHSEFPGLRAELVALPRIFSLSRREADIVISLTRPEEGRLFSRKLCDLRLNLYASRDYLVRNAPIKERSDLLQHDFITYVDEYMFSPELDYLPLIDRDIVPKFRISNIIAQLRAATAGMGLCVLPYLMAKEHPELSIVLPGIVNFTRTFWILVHADQRNLPHIRAVLDFIVKEAKASRELLAPEYATMP